MDIDKLNLPDFYYQIRITFDDTNLELLPQNFYYLHEKDEICLSKNKRLASLLSNNPNTRFSSIQDANDFLVQNFNYLDLKYNSPILEVISCHSFRN